MKKFDIPIIYRSPVISEIKKLRQVRDSRKQDYSPTVLDFGPVIFFIARHFGFCYGVENAIEISYKAIEENPGKRIFLLSEMIHNPEVNNDLQSRGVRFIMDTSGRQIVDWAELSRKDIVIIPAFGTTLEIHQTLAEQGLTLLKYDTTCPFVEKVWNRAAMLGKTGFTIVVHGKHKHEETRATFSHSKEYAPTIIVRDLEETKLLADVIKCNIRSEDFYKIFNGKYSEGFNPETDLDKIGVVNQTTMLATETQTIADYLKTAITEKYGIDNLKEHFSDTRDTLCYATHDNQRATIALLENDADIAIVVGGYNSSNTSHLVELCEEKVNTFFISSVSNIISKNLIKHFNFHNNTEQETNGYLPYKENIKILITSGASCPDSIVDDVINRIVSFFPDAESISNILEKLKTSN